MTDDQAPGLAPRPNPCPSCPYRRGCPSGLWDATEYARLSAWDGDIGDQAMAGAFGLFCCHSSPGDLCAGWVAHRDPADLLAIRVGISRGAVDPATLDYRTDVELWRTGAEAAAHGVRDLDDPSPAARAAVQKIMRLRPDVH